MFDKIRESVRRFEEIEKSIADPEVASQPARYASLMKERGKLMRVVTLARDLEKTRAERAQSEAIASDPEMKDMAAEELKRLSAHEEDLVRQLEDIVLVSDPNASRSVIMEIRPGAGGDEAALFAGELMRMYQKYATRQNWTFQVLDLSESDLRGVKYANISIEGEDVYKHLQFESGTHRVQRVPATEASGRVHTSTATVAVLPQAEEVDVEINAKDLRIDTYSAGGPGGQHVNKTQSAVRITHLPTNIVVQCQQERSQIRNRDLAMRWLRAKLYEHQLAQQQKKISDLRRTQIGTGDRSEKIRTYNFAQNRITDHRVTFSLHSLAEYLDGNIDEMVAKLLEEDRKKKLEHLKG